MDQRQSTDQALLWNELECGENPDLDRCDDISAGSHPAQGAEIARKPAQNSSAFERSPVREDCLHELLMKSEFKKTEAGNFNQMELFNL